MKFLLDSSAWLAHIFAEPGVKQVSEILLDPRAESYLCCLSLPEVCGRMKALGLPDKWPEVWQSYEPVFEQVLLVDPGIAHKAIEIRDATPTRIPTIDSLIAAVASVHKLTLVHRDPHMASIPSSYLTSIVIPDKV